jgi:cytochrome c2
MPATEQTWRDQKWMHVIFAVSGLAMLLSTLWMLYADYTRGWKPYQRKSQEVANWFTKAQITEQNTADFQQKRKELLAALDQAEAAPIDAALVQRFIAELQSARPNANFDDLNSELAAVNANPARETRTAFIERLDEYVKRARFDEDNIALKRKFERAEYDVARSDYELAVGNALPSDQLAKMEARAKAIDARVQELTMQYQAAMTHRKALEATLAEINRDVVQAAKAVADHDGALDQMEKTYAQQTRAGRNVLTLPILDAFNSPLQIKQTWLPNLTLNNNFREVARFDRCTTCHLGIDKTVAGSATEPGYLPTERLTVQLATPEAAPEPEKDEKGNPLPLTTAHVYGLELARIGLIHPNDVTVEVVWPYKAAAQAQLRAGDVIEWIGTTKVNSRDDAIRYLVSSAKWGQPIELKIRRGLPHPYSSHPRLDLFVGSLSPHTTEKFGCTICHQGQGSATDFKWASHMPNTLLQMERWKQEHGWFDNHHWIFPMHPERFHESSCLKCHHDVVELEPSEKFPDPPAPKLMQGYDIIRQYGCFGCHEINGYNGPAQRVGPDLRTEPNYTAAALQLLTDPGLPPEQQILAREVVSNPDEAQARRLLMQFVLADAASAERSPAPAAVEAEEAGGGEEGGVPAGPVLAAGSHALASVLADSDTPGTYRKPGPSLRYVASKVELPFLVDWIGNPTHFRPTTRMPRFFGLHDQFQPTPKVGADGAIVMREEVDEEGHAHQVPVMEPSPSLELAEKYEPIEIRAAAEYLLSVSQPFEYLAAPEGVTEQPSAERGKSVFQLRGCLACHQHKDFPEAKSTQGPDLSRIGAKLSQAPAEQPLYDWSARGPQWLYSWVRQPNRYHARTVMPNVFLDKITKDNQTSDPAADVTAYLLESQEGWKPGHVPEINPEDLLKLAKLHLENKYTVSQSAEYLENGIPESMANEVKGDESVLLGEFTDANRVERQLAYVGRRTLSKYGCSGCHDIPGYEDAKPIGTGLASWARKDLSQLAFEQISRYIETGGLEPHAAHDDGGHAADAHGGGHGVDLSALPPDIGFFTHKLLNHQREGFLWQKLRAPRSYDFRKTENKGYNEWLRMPKFNFDQQQIEAVMTFVLGLVAEPPAAQYIYKPTGRRQAIVEGSRVLEKFNCAGCHELQTEQWQFEFDPSNPDFADERPFPANEYAFFKPDFTPAELAASRKTDRRGKGHAQISARVVVNEQGEPQEEEDEDDETKLYRFYQLWKPAAINGQEWLSAEQVRVRTDWITGHRPPVGGDFARLIHPVALANERKTNPAAKWENAWGWVPPPLIHEGDKVQPEWLHNFLLDPYPIRPAVVLRMPKFNMSPDEAGKLVDYFAAIDNADYPYDFQARTRPGYLEELKSSDPDRLEDAMRIVTNGNYCIKCHLVDSYSPTGSDAAKAPNLARVYQRLRPEYTIPWLANPLRLLPYTGMPVNFPLDKPLDPNLFKGEGGELIQHGTSPEQLEAVVDFLQNFDHYMLQRNQLSITPPPPEPVPGAEGAPPAGEAEAEAGDDEARLDAPPAAASDAGS